MVRCEKLVTSAEFEKVLRYACDRRSQQLSDGNEWQQAVDIYAASLKIIPNDKHLIRNAGATWDQWARSFFKTKKWDEAVKVYKQAAKQFPNDETLKNNLKYAQQQAAKSSK